MSPPKYHLISEEYERLRRIAFFKQQKREELFGVILLGSSHVLNLAFIDIDFLYSNASYFIPFSMLDYISRYIFCGRKTFWGSFHSHPVSEPTPSDSDLSNAFLNGHELIYDVCGDEARLWERKNHSNKANIVELDLGCDNNNTMKAVSYGNRRTTNILSDTSDNAALYDDIANIGIERSSEPTRRLIRFFNELPDNGKEVAAWALGESEVKEATALLMKYMHYDNLDVRVSVIDALGKIGNTRTALELTSLLDEDNEIVREHTYIALGEIGCDATAKYINNSIYKYGPSREALWALSRTDSDGSNIIELARSHERVNRISAIDVIRESCNIDAKALLVKMLDDDDCIVRAAIGAVGKVGDYNTLGKLRTLYKRMGDCEKIETLSAMVNIISKGKYKNMKELVKREMLELVNNMINEND